VALEEQETFPPTTKPSFVGEWLGNLIWERKILLDNIKEDIYEQVPY